MIGVLRAELSGVTGSRSIVAGVLLAFAVAAMFPVVLQPPGDVPAMVPAAMLSEGALRAAQLPLLAAAALVGGRHFQDGQFATTLCAVPRRGILVLAQAAVALVWSITAAAGTALLAVVAARSTGAQASLAPDPPVLDSTAYLVLMMLLAWGTTLLLRRSWAAMALLGALCATVPVLSMMIPPAGILPGGAGVELLTPGGIDLLGSSAIWLGGWALVAAGAGAASVLLRDAETH
ncbi:MAG: hypothetical protein ACTHUU_15500 [Brachybacterium sp.]